MTEVAEVARETSASLVVVGSAPHSRFGHQVAGGRAAQLIRTVDCPVWSVDPHPFVAPRSAVVAVDFGRASTRAARAALALLEPGGTLTLLHVLPHREADRGPRDRVEVVECAMRLRQFRDELRPFVPQGTIVETLTISGTVSEVVRRSAEVLGADLVVVGTNGPGLVERLLVGSVAADVLHNPGMTVLACPPDRVAKVRGSGHRAPPGIRTAPAGI